MDEKRELTEIIEACVAGEQEGFARLVDMYGKRIYGYFYRQTGKRATSEDLLSELFLKLIVKIHSFQIKKGAFENWLFRVASNVFYDYLRQQQRRKKALDKRVEKFVRDEAKQEVKKSDGEILDKLQTQLDRLDVETRELIVLRYYSQLSFEEIAKLRGEPVGTVLSKIHRGIKKLRAELTE